jgi:hypothetical protein
MKMLNGEIVTSPTLKPKKAAPKSIGTSLRCSPQGARTSPAATAKSTSLIRPAKRTPASSSELRLKPMLMIRRCPIRAVGARASPMASSARTIDMNNMHATTKTRTNCSSKKLPKAA